MHVQTGFQQRLSISLLDEPSRQGTMPSKRGIVETVHGAMSSVGPNTSLSDNGVTGNSDVLGRLFSENPVSSVPSDTVSKSNKRLEPSSSGSGAAVDV